MRPTAKPGDASIDGLIDWLRENRQRDPASPLSVLLSDYRVDPQRLVDLACIDLMQRRRMGQAVTVETYVQEFPDLASESNLLDLIDAEICVATELGQQIDVDGYASRFPHLLDQIAELARLERGAAAELASALIGVGDAVVHCDEDPPRGEQNSVSQSADFSVDVPPQEATASRQVSKLPEHLLDVPEWFIGEGCVASGAGRWLMRGRDAVRGTALGMKVIELPLQVSAAGSEQILDACELAAKVRNPSWVPPSIAAIQRRYLGVIRPWQFASPWQPSAASQNPAEQLRRLASVAFAVESAHRIGATHGGIHAENLLVDHSGKVRVLDAGSSRMGLHRWLSPSAPESPLQIASLDQRRAVDVQDLIKLVAVASVQWNHQWARDLVADLQRISTEDAGGACGLIGQLLMQHADSWRPERAGGSSRGGQHGTWRKRWARWLAKQE